MIFSEPLLKNVNNGTALFFKRLPESFLVAFIHQIGGQGFCTWQQPIRLA
jgi:hypothetical protein